MASSISGTRYKEIGFYSMRKYTVSTLADAVAALRSLSRLPASVPKELSNGQTP